MLRATQKYRAWIRSSRVVLPAVTSASRRSRAGVMVWPSLDRPANHRDTSFHLGMVDRARTGTTSWAGGMDGSGTSWGCSPTRHS